MPCPGADTRSHGAGARRYKHFPFSRSFVDAVPLPVCDRQETFIVRSHDGH
ncbi:MAG: hypothetical protein AB4352_14285 [Hormoscilla sp.]